MANVAQNLFDMTVNTYSTLDILINSAGIIDNFEPDGDIEDALWERNTKILISICAKFKLTTINAPGQRMVYILRNTTKRSARRVYLKDNILKEKEVKSRNGDWEAFCFGTPFIKFQGVYLTKLLTYHNI